MNAYVYQSALWCEDCGIAIRLRLARENATPDDPQDESTYDSGDYPKGPYADGGGMSNSPEHCDGCGVFLENPLTADGLAYVEERVQVNASGTQVAREVWAPFYGIEVSR